MSIETEFVSTGDQVASIYRRHLSAGRARVGEMLGGHVETESSGVWVTTGDGGRYLNAGGYGVFIMGARHPRVIEAVGRQLDRHPVGSRMFLEPMAAEAAEALMAVAPSNLTRVHFSGSGTEATETALKLARLNGRTHLVAMRNGYHGKTLGALSVTGRDVFQDPFRPLLPDVTHIPFANLPALAAALTRHPGAACVIVEPVQGEGGVIVPPDGYLRSVADLCREYGALLVVDEIQTGLGRTGHWWALESEGVRPDILLAGKALGGGVIPVSAAIATEQVYAPLDRDPFLHTSTFAAAPIAMAAVCGALQAITEDDLVARAARIGAELLAALETIVEAELPGHRCRVRGRGLLIGIEFADPAMAADLLIELITNNVIANHSLNSDRVVRLTPPATLSASEIEFLLTRFETSARAVATRYPEG
ncbi:aspartate aminotransferase family protein [Nocardia veterana]|uniref:Aspartate aminotransferase family protein n=1 Tax=Nocardia veterana TaxID=132249 RepID=A0A7X6RFJ3_9NOCA|nr:aminotransferase class III-fold pyridoxal phosphate-dependent enzyme [Nocardia veterana]NKY84036.1 aspartate aminotransferase family protein [Nocardia veterana]